jgi:alpha-ribazole phosphatase
MRTAIYFVRHGQTIANKQRRYQSYSDSPLTAYGQAQARALAQRLQRLPFDVALISPLGRCRATAEMILADRDNVARVESPEWTEVHHGRWEGLNYAEVLVNFPDEARERWGQGIHGKAQGGESLAEAVTRIDAAWQCLLERYPGGRVLVVTHATPIQLVICRIFSLTPTIQWQWRIDQGSLTAMDVYAAGTIIRCVNEVPRLT